MKAMAELVPFRFVALTVHGCASVSLYFLKTETIAVTLEPVSRSYSRSELHRDYRHALRRVEIVLFWSWACFVVEFFGLFQAYSLTWPRVTLYNAVSHACGAFLVLWAQLDCWAYFALEYIFVFFSLFPAVLELCVGLFLARQDINSVILLGSAAISAAVVGFPLLYYVDRSIKSSSTLGAAAYFGIVLSSLSLILAAILVAVVLICPPHESTRAPIRNRPPAEEVEDEDERMRRRTSSSLEDDGFPEESTNRHKESHHADLLHSDDEDDEDDEDDDDD